MSDVLSSSVFPHVLSFHIGTQIFTVYSAAQRYLRYLVSKFKLQSNFLEQIVFFSSGFEQTSRQGFFFLIFPYFSIFFRETTFLESNAGGPPTGGSHRAGLVVSKKKGRKKKES